jgi:hypothetical protein
MEIDVRAHGAKGATHHDVLVVATGGEVVTIRTLGAAGAG